MSKVPINDPVILLVEDERYMRGLLRQMLQRLDLRQIVEAKDAAEGRAALEKQQFDLCIAHMWLKPESGLDFLRFVRKHAEPAIKRIRFLLLSADATEKTVKLAVQSGANGFVIKPFSQNTVTERVRAILKKDQKTADDEFEMIDQTKVTIHHREAEPSFVAGPVKDPFAGVDLKDLGID
jgi:two-component system chemotaxis response regulator CheY